MIYMLSSINKINLKKLKDPFLIYKPKILKQSVNYFKKNFSGEALYAVKANPSKFVLKKIYELGIRSFDVASINEIKLVKNLFDNSKIFFMNPVKPRHVINEAYHKYGVRDFSLDNDTELHKILESTGSAKDLNLHLRISVPNNSSKINLSKKFGTDGFKSKVLLNKIKNISRKVGVSFHLGSQCINPNAYKIAINKTSSLIRASNLDVDFFNVGGGFPAEYSGLKLQPLTKYFKVINTEFEKNFKNSKTKLLSEPGRVLVSKSMSLIVRVDLRKKNILYINDGTHSFLHDAGAHDFIYPVKIFNKEEKSKLKPFSFYGPTCDSNDFMRGPFLLPESINEGDYLQIEEMGAYSLSMKNNFNGFFSTPKIFIDEEK